VPVVVIVSVTAAGFEPGVTELADRLQVVFEGTPLQLSLTAFENVPPTGATLSV